jgi:hypothetical protein
MATRVIVGTASLRISVGSYEEVHLEVHQFPRQGRKPLVFAAGPPVLDREVPPLYVAQVAELLLECG